MKRIAKKTGIIAAAIMMLFAVSSQRVAAQTGYGDYGDDYVSYDDYSDVTYQDFYNDLSPYGQWINDPQYGYVWCPSVESGFRPYYTQGHWVMTDYGNTWVSDYRWGWATFHYGRWTYDNYYGWVWIPGYQWAPAWVSWRNGGGYYGWAPLGPGVNISVSLGNNWWGADFWWTFIPQRYLFYNDFYRYYRGPRYNNTYINNTTYIYNTHVTNHATYYYGPRAADYQRATNQHVTVYKVNNDRRPGATSIRSNTVNIYRPPVRNNTTVNGRRPAPDNAIQAPRAIGRSNAVKINPGTALPVSKPTFNPRDYRNVQQQQPRTTVPVQNQNNRGVQQRNDQRANQQQLEQQRVNQQRIEQQRAAEQQRTNQQRMEQQRAAEQQRVNIQRVEQQRAAEQQRANQQRMEQQRAAEQQRANQQRMEQQRAAEQQRANQQRMEQQRAAEQQRANQQRANQQRTEQQRQQRPAPQERNNSDRRR